MKISYRNHPILEKLHNGSLGDIPVFNTDVLFHRDVEPTFKRIWEENKVAFNGQVYKISQAFSDAANKAYDKLFPVFIEMIESEIGFRCNGTYLFGDWVHMINYDHPNPNHESNENNTVIFVFLKTGQPVLYFAECGANLKGWVSNEILNGNVFGVPIRTQDELSNLAFSMVVRCVIVEMFKSYAEVETKNIPANSKVKDIACKYVNDTKLNLIYLDSKWFTNLVKSDGFNVRGHFRLQPKKKDGAWTKELIWINEFKKSGYTAPARKLKAMQTDNT